MSREISECEQSIQNLQGLYTKNQQQLADDKQNELQARHKKDELQNLLEEHRQALANVRHQADQQRRTADELSVRCAAIENELALLKQSSLRDERQRAQLLERKQQLAGRSENEATVEDLRLHLQQLLSQRLEIEEQLRKAQDLLSDQLEKQTQFSAQRQDIQQQLALAQTEWQNLQMERQALAVRQSTIQEQLVEQNWVLEELLAKLSEAANAAEWEQQLAAVTARIQRLGAINLAAIDEFQTVNERKSYLDKQQADLNEALTVLQSAIQKIDRESRSQFQDTFNKVNENFQQLFPQIFGGGRANLELLDEDWLSAGIMVKAQPPGKRNATIYMLSGGEKALTAVALVFSMFKINPAPFCVLDEVDAPLDDINTGRFCQLVKEMAKTTQFIVISHNKVTISMAERLMGVTMQEPGVSRVVSVNVAEAVALAEA